MDYAVGRAEQRRDRRAPPAEFEVLRMRIVPEGEAMPVNLSAGGALIESNVRLLPCSRIALEFGGAGFRFTARGRVVRAWIVGLDEGHGPRYRGAIQFECRSAQLWASLAHDG